MKKLLLIPFSISLFSCGDSAQEELAKRELRKQDSLAIVEKQKQEEQRISDSLMYLEQVEEQRRLDSVYNATIK